MVCQNTRLLLYTPLQYDASAHNETATRLKQVEGRVHENNQPSSNQLSLLETQFFSCKKTKM